MPKSYIVDASAFDTPSDIKPGVYSGDIFDKEPPTEQPKEQSMIGKAAEYLPTAGAFAGGLASALAAPGTAGASLLGGSALVGLGAAAGKAGEQIVKRIIGEEAPKTPAEAAKQIGIEGATSAAINAAGGKLLEAGTPIIKQTAKQVMRGFAHLDERLSMKVLNDPDILNRALPLEKAKANFSKFFEDNGYTYGQRSVKAATGKLALSDNAEDTFIADVIDEIEKVGPKTKPNKLKATVQNALAARYAAKDAISRGVRSGNNSRVRLFLEGRNQIDDWLETQLPGFSAVRKEYEEAKIKEAFKPLFPLNKNKETSILGVLTSLGATIGTGAINPVAGAATAAISSPKLAGLAIRGSKAASDIGVGGAVSQLVGEKAREIVAKPNEIAKEEKDHPQLSDEEAALIVKQEKEKDPNFYSKEK